MTILLLIKSKQIAHAAGYYFHNHRWHSLKEGQKAPKGAPQAQHPTAAGEHAPAKHFTDEQWAKLKLPEGHTSAPHYNKKLDTIKELSESGNVTGLLGLQIGSDTYGKQAAKVANKLLQMHGSQHQVTAGQKAGSHPAVQAAPTEPTPAPDATDTDVGTKPEAAPAPAKDTYFPMPAFVEGKQATGVVDYYEKAAGKIMAVAEAGDLDGLHAMKDDGLKPNKKGKVSNTWAGKTANSKLLIQLHNKALAHVAAKAVSEKLPNPKPEPESAAPASEPEKPKQVIGDLIKQKMAAVSIDWESYKLPVTNKNVKHYNAKVDEIKAATDAGDIAKLEGMKFSINTYGKKAQKLATAAIMTLKGAAPAPAPEPKVEKPAEPAPKDHLASIANAGSASTAEMYAYLHVEDKGKTKESYQQAAGALAAQGYHKQAKTILSSMTEKFGSKNSDATSTPANTKPAKPNLSTYESSVDSVEKNIETGDLGALESYQQQIAKLGDDGKDKNFTALAQYVKDGINYLKGGTQDPSPKDGDTKQGADGMLVFKNGRWHKQEEAKPADITPSWLDGITIPDFTAGATSHQTNGLNIMAKDIMEAAKLHGPEGLKGKITQHKTGKKAGTVTVQAGGYKVSAMGGNSKIEAVNNFHKFVTDLLAATGKTKKTKKPKAAPAASAPTIGANGIQSMDSWQQTGPQGGSNPGGRFKDENGVEWYCKFPADEDVAKSEVLAAKLYAATGVAGQDAKLITKGGKVGIASRWTEVSKTTASALKKTDGVHSGFAVDAWLGNWDVVGLGFDNLQVGADGKAVRIDAGGSLEYRAQGGKKAFGNNVSELDSLRDASINPQAAAVFSGITQADIAASASKVAKLSDDSIRILVNTYGPGDAAAKQALADTLIARKADILAKYPAAAKKKKTITFKPEKISEPPSFVNWGGSGKSGPSSKEFLNQANEQAVQAIFAAAKTGKIEAVQNLTANVFNKDTGDVTGSAKVLEHPSQHVKGYAQQAINEINYQLNPPKRFRFDGGHPLHSLNSAYPAHKGAAHGAAVSKVGKYVLLGEPGTISLDALALPKLTYQSGAVTKTTFAAAAQEAYSKMPLTQQQAVRSYTGSSYHSMNSSLWQGNPSGAAKAAGEALHTLGHEITPGTVLSRKMSIHGADLDQILKTVGKVIQEPAIMSTSIRPSSWSGNVQLKMHVGPGVKGLWVGQNSVKGGGSISNHSGEDEIILPPNTRMLVLSTKKGSSPDADGFGGHSDHIIEVVILPTQDHA